MQNNRLIKLRFQNSKFFGFFDKLSHDYFVGIHIIVNLLNVFFIPMRVMNQHAYTDFIKHLEAPPYDQEIGFWENLVLKWKVLGTKYICKMINKGQHRQ